ncbi:MAG: tRNA pseudouridine synthase B [Phycisphaerae bacterium]|nr:tRNA pseudouridine synthase B [Phycisphaerae bacterium]
MNMSTLGFQFDGLLNLHKPTGITSARALNQVRRVTSLRKSGHAGTLDPAATGVLLICFGKATKRVEQLMTLPKTYEATGRLDVTSQSYDADSPFETITIERIPEHSAVEQVLRQMVGEIEQVPPAISALKVGGVPAYKLARRRQPVELAARRVTIYQLHLQEYQWPNIRFTVGCSRGTYIRALIRDLGAALQVGGCLTALARTAVGPFTSAQAVPLAELDTTRFEISRLPLAELDQLLAAQRNDDRTTALG